MNIALDFLPENYKSPKTSGNYTKLQKGENRIRILSKPIFGWEDWIENKPVRYGMYKKPSKSFDSKKPMRHFWAFIVYNYNDEQIQIMQVSQCTIIKGLENLCRDKDWGSPFGYDLKIVKTGEGVKTEYAVNPLPHKPVDPAILEVFHERRCNLNALFAGQDPFSEEATCEAWTLLANEEPKIVSLKEERLTVSEITELANLLGTMPPEFCDEVQAFMKKQKIDSYDAIPRPMYERLIKKIKGGN